MMSANEKKDYVLQFFRSWERGTFNDLQESYRKYLASDVLYENSGAPACHGIDEAVALIESVCLLKSMDIQTIKVEMCAIAVEGDLVFTERIDYHYNATGEAVLVPYICGVMVFKDDKIVRWSDYFDPTEFVRALEIRAALQAS